ncbi:MAG: flagellar hook-basal body protein FliE [Planctomycetes bacterium ADurb.Bin412]|nr:MAG: flagellar hook-basal body protein FliE [Planctomycetes bacterium ADurb.Bin412]
MVEQFQSINTSGLLNTGTDIKSTQAPGKTADGKDFKSVLMESIDEVNRLQTEADTARINLATGKTENVAEVFTAVKKADLAFQTLMQIRNKLMDAYDEIKQMRV